MAQFRQAHSIYLLISQPVQYTKTMAENSNFVAEGQKSHFDIEIVNLLVDLAETTSL